MTNLTATQSITELDFEILALQAQLVHLQARRDAISGIKRILV